MDYQTTDGVAMLLRYVSPYVTKAHDCTEIDSLYSYELIKGGQAAINYLMRNKPAEPEMWLFLLPKKWHGAVEQRGTMSRHETATNDIHQ